MLQRSVDENRNCFIDNDIVYLFIEKKIQRAKNIVWIVDSLKYVPLIRLNCKSVMTVLSIAFDKTKKNTAQWIQQKRTRNNFTRVYRSGFFVDKQKKILEWFFSPSELIERLKTFVKRRNESENRMNNFFWLEKYSKSIESKWKGFELLMPHERRKQFVYLYLCVVNEIHTHTG